MFSLIKVISESAQLKEELLRVQLATQVLYTLFSNESLELDNNKSPFNFKGKPALSYPFRDFYYLVILMDNSTFLSFELQALDDFLHPFQSK